jgi:hypothetical protein
MEALLWGVLGLIVIVGFIGGISAAVALGRAPYRDR